MASVVEEPCQKDIKEQKFAKSCEGIVVRVSFRTQGSVHGRGNSRTAGIETLIASNFFHYNKKMISE